MAETMAHALRDHLQCCNTGKWRDVWTLLQDAQPALTRTPERRTRSRTRGS
jgi:hypothetical protein